VDEIRGRLLHEALLREAVAQTLIWAEGLPVTIPPPMEPPDFPTLAKTDTGTLHAVVVAS
jgi:hypothetical protein